MNDIKIFFFDVDYTSFDHSIFAVRESTMNGLRQLKEKGYKLYVCTSRSYDEMRNIPKDFMNLMNGFITLAGSYIIREGEASYSTIDRDDLEKGLKYFRENDLPYRYATNDGKGYMSHDLRDVNDAFYVLYHMVPELKEYEGEEVVHILYYSHNDSDEDNVKKIFKKESHNSFGNPYEIMPPGVDKGEAALRIAESYGYARENICAFGDSNNDLTLLKMAGLGIAMGNGSKEAKECADYVTDDISDEGLYNALKKFGFVD